MPQDSTRFPRTIGMDLGRTKSNDCIFEDNQERTDENETLSNRDTLRSFFNSQPTSRVVTEACGPCRWIALEATKACHEVMVANCRGGTASVFHLAC